MIGIRGSAERVGRQRGSDPFVGVGREGQTPLIGPGATGAVLDLLEPFGRGYSGGIAVATADVQRGGTSDVIVGRIRGRRTLIQVIDPRTGHRLREMVAFRRVFHRGLSLTTGIADDGTPEIIARSTGRHHQALVQVFDGRTGATIGGTERLPAGPAALARSRRS